MQNPRFKNIFPASIDFYGMAEVSSNSESFQEKAVKLDYPCAPIVVRLIDTDFLGLAPKNAGSAGLCLFQFTSEPRDRSMALELANILASRLAASVSKEIGAKILVAPGEWLDADDRGGRAFARQAAQSAQHPSRIYSFKKDEEFFFIRMLFIPPISGMA